MGELGVEGGPAGPHAKRGPPVVKAGSGESSETSQGAKRRRVSAGSEPAETRTAHGMAACALLPQLPTGTASGWVLVGWTDLTVVITSAYPQTIRLDAPMMVAPAHTATNEACFGFSLIYMIFPI